MALPTTTPLALPAAPAPHPLARPEPAASNPRAPGDLGLTGAGLVAQAVGAIGMGLSLFAAMTLTMGGDVPRRARTLFIAAALLGTVRSVLHMLAGLALAKRSPRLFRSVQIYGAVALIHTAVLALAFRDLTALPLVGPLGLGTILVISLGWPIALSALVLRPATRRLFETAASFELPVLTADRGVAGAGVLMLAGGTLFAAIYAALLVFTLGTPDATLKVVVLLALLGRSLVHAAGGVAALRRPSAEGFEAIVNRYSVAAFVGTGAVVIAVLVSGTGGVLGFLFLAVLAMSWFLGWPFALVGFARQVRQMSLAGLVGEPERRLAAAPDGGLTTLGALLIWYGTVAFGRALGGFGDHYTGALVAVLQALASGLFLWAGLELALMTRRWRLAALVFASATLVVACVTVIAPFGASELGGDGSFLSLFTGPSAELVTQRWAGVLAELVLPIVTLVLALRMPRWMGAK